MSHFRKSSSLITIVGLVKGSNKMNLPSLLTLASLYTTKFHEYNDATFPKVHDGLRANVLKILQDPFDFIIVGTGFSGSFLARRLAAGGCYRILLLEAGGMPSFDSAIPFVNLGNMSKHEWNYMTVPQKNAAKGMKEEKIRLMVGKSLGGTSVLDTGMYLPANLEDFHRWSYIYQLSGWSYNDMRKYLFELSQHERDSVGFRVHPLDLLNLNDTDLLAMLDEGFHERVMDPLKFVWLRAATQMKQPIRYGEEQELFTDGGFFVPKTLSQSGLKINPASQFLRDVGDNVVVLCHVEAEKLIFSKDGRTAIGVLVKDSVSGQTHPSFAKKQVILAAGAIGTAKILLQSGIGPIDLLKQEGIHPIANLPVGVRLNDRVKASLIVKVDSVAMEALKNEVNDPVQMELYLNNGSGILANTSVIGAAYIKTGYLTTADLMLQLQPAGLLGMHKMMEPMNFKDETIDEMDKDHVLDNEACLEITITVLRPFSTGTMWIWRYANESYVPRMNPSYLADDRDVTALSLGAKYIEALLQTDLMKEMGAKLLYPSFSNCSEPLFPITDEYWRCTMRYLATSGMHLTSTAPFGDVVDSRLKVRGIQGVRIADESVLPESATGGIQATLLAIANRAAKILEEDVIIPCERN